MTKTEVAKLLTLIVAFDRRTIGEADVEAWHLIVADLEADDCAAAVKHHYSTSRDWLMPSDVRTFAVNAARGREGQRRQAELDAQLAAENPPGELKSRPVAALTTGHLVPVDNEVRVDRRAQLRAAAHTKRQQTEADVAAVAAADAHREQLEQARRDCASREPARMPEVADATSL